MAAYWSNLAMVTSVVVYLLALSAFAAEWAAARRLEPERALPAGVLLDLSGPWFWVFILIVLAGCVVELLRGLALSTTVTLLVPEPKHANANGLVGMVQGLSFIVTSVFSGL